MLRENIKPNIFAIIIGSILLGSTGLLARVCSDAPTGVSVQEKCCISFMGKASGGTLIFYKYLGGNAQCVFVETISDEPAERVISRLADTIEETNPFDWIIVRGGSHETGARIVTSSGGTLKGLVCDSYMIAGTETGLGIPKPPNSLTCNYNPETNNISLRWINPSSNAYDVIKVMIKGSGDTIPGNSESYLIDLNKYQAQLKSNTDFYLNMMGPNSHTVPKDSSDELNIWIYGIRNDIPSNATAINVNKNIQQELNGIPFTCGIAPNWQFWSLDSNDNNLIVEQNIRHGIPPVSNFQYHPVKTPQTKPYYQTISTGAKGGTGGIHRKFIGLTPGHTYRIKTRVAILKEPNENNWSVSVHATTSKLDLGPRQMAGLDALPDSNKGNTAGRMALYDSTFSTKGQFIGISTDKTKQVLGREVTDITLPEGTDTITVWVRCISSEAMSAAIDWISLEDLSG